MNSLWTLSLLAASICLSASGQDPFLGVWVYDYGENQLFEDSLREDSETIQEGFDKLPAALFVGVCKDIEVTISDTSVEFFWPETDQRLSWAVRERSESRLKSEGFEILDGPDHFYGWVFELSDGGIVLVHQGLKIHFERIQEIESNHLVDTTPDSRSAPSGRVSP